MKSKSKIKHPFVLLPSFWNSRLQPQLDGSLSGLRSSARAMSWIINFDVKTLIWTTIIHRAYEDVNAPS